ncbi:MAG: hypothetical protein ACHQF2_01470 [Flavobacteriales bacterium]
MKYIAKNRFCILVGLVLTCVNPAVAQEEEKVIIQEKIPDVVHSFRGGFKLPTIYGNRSFRKALEGVGNFEFSYQTPVIGGLMLGAGGNSSYYDINFNALPELDKGSYLSVGGFGLIGWEKFVAPRFYLSFHQKIGYQYFRFKTPNCSAMPGSMDEGSSMFTETQVGIYATGNERMSYGLLIGYQFSFFNFGPQWVCRDSFSGMSAEDYIGNGRILNIGFGFSIVIGKLQ